MPPSAAKQAAKEIDSASRNAPRPTKQECDKLPGTVLSASGHIVAHHMINVNSKVTGRAAWIGVGKGNKVKQGQDLVRLENDEFQAQVKGAEGRPAKLS